MSIKIGCAEKSGIFVLHYGNPDFIKQVKKVKTETFYGYKPLKPLCEFCKEKIGLLNDDVFIKQAEKLSKE